MNENDDENIKKARQAESFALLQSKAKDYQDKLTSLQNKEYQGKYFGVFIRMKGSFEVIDVRIEQAFYETAGKGQIEKAFLTCYGNLYRSIQADQDGLKQELQSDVDQIQKSALNDQFK